MTTNGAQTYNDDVTPGATGTLNSGTGHLTFAKLLSVSALTLTLMDASSADLGTSTVLAAGVINAANGVTLSSGDSLTGSTAVNWTVTAQAGSTISPDAAGPGILSTGSLAWTGAAYNADLDGTTVGTGYDQLAVTGAVSLGDSTLSLDVGFSPAPGDSFTLISNDGTDPVSGTFAGLPEGSTFGAGGQSFQITYAGQTGNDLVLGFVPLTATPTVTRTATHTATATATNTAALTSTPAVTATAVPATATPPATATSTLTPTPTSTPTGGAPTLTGIRGSSPGAAARPAGCGDLAPDLTARSAWRATAVTGDLSGLLPERALANGNDTDNRIGMDGDEIRDTLEGNWISGNLGPGISIACSSPGTRIAGNSIEGNGRHGVDLAFDRARP